MKFVIAVDLEGLACVTGEHGGDTPSLGDDVALSNYDFARKQGVREANAAADALFECGASEVVIIDGHSKGVNLPYDLVDTRCLIQLGCGGTGSRYPSVTSDCAGLLLIGYHAMDSTSDAVLAHSFSSVDYQSIEVNGRPVGEIGIDAAIAGSRGVPVIFVSSDDKGTNEARGFLPWIETVTTKVSHGYNLAVSEHPLRILDEIHDGVRRAVERLDEMEVFELEPPLTFVTRYARIDSAEVACSALCGWERVDAYTVKKTGSSMRDFY